MKGCRNSLCHLKHNQRIMKRGKESKSELGQRERRKVILHILKLLTLLDIAILKAYLCHSIKSQWETLTFSMIEFKAFNLLH